MFIHNMKTQQHRNLNNK